MASSHDLGSEVPVAPPSAKPTPPQNVPPGQESWEQWAAEKKNDFDKAANEIYAQAQAGAADLQKQIAESETAKKIEESVAAMQSAHAANVEAAKKYVQDLQTKGTPPPVPPGSTETPETTTTSQEEVPGVINQ